MTPFEITFYEGTFAFILNIVFLLIATNTSMVDPPKLIDLAAHEKYEGKEYLDNFYGYWEKFKGTEILAFIVLMFSRALFNLFEDISIFSRWQLFIILFSLFTNGCGIIYLFEFFDLYTIFWGYIFFDLLRIIFS